MELKNLDKYVDLLRLSLFSILLGVLGFSVSKLLLIIYPALFMESSLRNKLIPTMASMFICSLIIGLINNLMGGLALFFVFAPMVLIFHYSVTSKKSYLVTFLLMFIVLFLSITSLEMGLVRLEPIDMEGYIEKLIEIQLESAGALSNLELSRLETSLREIINLSIILTPAFYIIAVSVIVYINYVYAGRKLLFKGIIINQPPIFAFFQLSRVTFLVLGAFIGLAVLLKYLNYSNYDLLYLNTLVVFGFLFLVDGFSLVSNLLIRFKVPLMARMILYLSGIFIKNISIGVIVLGILDTLIYFRRIRIKVE